MNSNTSAHGPINLPTPSPSSSQSTAPTLNRTPDTPPTPLNDTSIFILSSNSILGSPISLRSSNSFTSFISQKDNLPPLQPHLRKWKHTEEEHLVEKLELVGTTLQWISTDFGCIGEFLRLLFWDHEHKKDDDLQISFHKKVVAKFLSGQGSVKAAQIDDAMFSHQNSNPSWHSPRRNE
ncbi:hypothetical protein VKT23_014000 [Stygiomarasmius scandens]|uniref:Uncharacterized protein n=1 Tax=Marasmiellus scandens TaxID=2682957 RepID=A0ABR1J6Q4_9AGAR